MKHNKRIFMNVRYTSALLLVLSFLASSLVFAVPHISIRSQGQNIVHTTLQQTKMHLPSSATIDDIAAASTAPVQSLSTSPAPTRKETASAAPENATSTILAPVNSLQEKPTQTFFEKIKEALTPNSETIDKQPPLTQNAPTPQDSAAIKQLAKTLDQIVPKIPKALDLNTTIPSMHDQDTDTPNTHATSAPILTTRTLTAASKNLPQKTSALSTKNPTTFKKLSPQKIKKRPSTTLHKARPQKSIQLKKLKDTPSTLITPKKTTTKKTLHNTIPRDTQSYPSPKKIQPTPKKIQPKNKQSLCSTTKPAFEIYPPISGLQQPHSTPTMYTYPAIEDSLRSLPAAPVFYIYPAIDTTSQPCSTKTFEIYPAIEDSPQQIQSLKMQPTPSTPLVEKTPKTELAVQATEPLVEPTSTALSETSPIQELTGQAAEPLVKAISTSFSETYPAQEVVAQATELKVQATPQEQLMPLTTTTSWVDRAKNRYEKSVAYFKELFSPKNSTAPLSNAVLHSQNAAMEVHSVDTIDGSSDKDISGNFTLQPEVMRSFRPHALTRALFGCDLYNDTTLHIRGSARARNDAKDWLADYFYLSNNYEGIVCFTPRITSFLTDLSLFIDLNSWFNGCFLRVESPLTWTKWDLGMREQIINSGNVTGAQGWRGNWTSVDTKLLSSFTDYSCWEKAGTSYVDSVGLAHPLYAAKLCPCGRAKTELADLHVDFGVHAHEGEHYHVGLYARGVMPTGTKPDGEFLFEPIVGNGHYWELGGGVNGYAQLWKAADRSQEVGLYLDGSITHLFSSHQQRVFDLKGHGLLSRYMLVTNNPTAPSSLTPAANITSAQVNVSIPMQIDLIALVNYANDVFSWNCGYNFWARSCEKIDCCDIMANNVCDNCSATSGLDGITWMPYTDSTIKNLGEASLAPALSQDDLDLNSSRTKGSSHKIFTSLNYSWIDIDDVVVPFLGIGAELELGKAESATANACCNRVSLSQWGLWLRMGTEF